MSCVYMLKKHYAKQLIISTYQAHGFFPCTQVPAPNLKLQMIYIHIFIFIIYSLQNPQHMLLVDLSVVKLGTGNL